MAAERVTLHLDPIQSSANVLTIIETLGRDPLTPFMTAGEIIARVRSDYEFTDRTEPVVMAHAVGLLDKEGQTFGLSATGRAVHAVRPAARADLLHALLWDASLAEGNGAAWAYRRFCTRLWERARVDLSSTEVTSLVADILSEAPAAFPGADRFSFSRKSILGMRRWLEPLAPPVLHENEFRRRDICSWELLLLAIGQVAQADGADIGADLLLSSERRADICRICLLEPAVFDRRLDHLIPIYPRVLTTGTRTGAYGRFVRLHAWPTVEDLVTSS